MVVGICASPLLPMLPRVTEALTPMSVLTSGVPVTVPDVVSSASKFVSVVSLSNAAKALFPKGGTCEDDWSSVVVPAGTLVNVAVAVAVKSQTVGTSNVCTKVEVTAAPPLIGIWVGADAGSGPGPKPTVHALGDGGAVGVAVGALVVETVLNLRGHGTLNAEDFPPAFIVVGLIAASSTFLFATLPPDAGADMAKRHGTKRRESADTESVA